MDEETKLASTDSLDLVELSMAIEEVLSRQSLAAGRRDALLQEIEVLLARSHVTADERGQIMREIRARMDR